MPSEAPAKRVERWWHEKSGFGPNKERKKMQGIVKKIKGTYGFILIENDRQIFYHASSWLSKDSATEGDTVEFDVIPSHKPQFKEQAIHVKKITTKTEDGMQVLGGVVKS
jgi:cold shock CspA family protein